MVSVIVLITMNFLSMASMLYWHRQCREAQEALRESHKHTQDLQETIQRILVLVDDYEEALGLPPSPSEWDGQQTIPFEEDET